MKTRLNLAVWFAANVTIWAAIIFAAPDRKASSTFRPMLIDCDPGTDDAIALLMAFKSPEISVVGVSVVAGNGELIDMAANAKRVMHAVPHLPKIPIFKGLARPIMGVYQEVERSTAWFGVDMLGDKPDLHPKRLTNSEVDYLCEDKHAAQGIIDLSKKYNGELEIVMLGPLSNLALAVKLDPELPKRVKKLTIMGGNIQTKYRQYHSASFNFRLDVEAAYIVLTEFHSLGDQLIISPSSANKKAGKERPELFQLDDLLASASNRTRQFYAHLVSGYVGSKMGSLADGFTMAIAIEPEVVSRVEIKSSVVALDGTDTRGLLLNPARWDKKYSFLKPVSVVYDINPEKYLKVLKLGFTH